MFKPKYYIHEKLNNLINISIDEIELILNGNLEANTKINNIQIHILVDDMYDVWLEPADDPDGNYIEIKEK